jgi:hypothetical protein
MIGESGEPSHAQFVNAATTGRSRPGNPPTRTLEETPVARKKAPQSDVIEQSIVRLLHGRKQFWRCDRQLASVQMRRFLVLIGACRRRSLAMLNLSSASAPCSALRPEN